MQIEDRVHEFLNRSMPGLIATVATNGRDGYPVVVPVWYRWDGTRIIVWTLESRLWVRNAIRDPKLGVSVQETDTGGMAVIMRGTATVRTSDESDVDEEIRRITGRYVAEADMPDYLKGWEHLRTLISIVPEKMFVWG